MKFSKRRQKDHLQVVPGAQESEGLSLDEALELFLMFQSSANHSDMTKKSYYIVIRQFLSYIREVCQYTLISEIAEQDVMEWLAYLHDVPNKRGRPYSSRTIETYSRDVSVFFNWLAVHGHLPVSPMANLKRPKTEKALIRLFSEDELRCLDVACDRSSKGAALTEDERRALAARDRAFLWLLLSTGVRVSEACGLTFADIDWKEGMIYVHGKGAKERHIPFGKVAHQHLDTYVRYWRGESLDKVRPDDHIFLTAFGNPMRSHNGLGIFTRLKRIAGITDKRVSPHTCRHWFAVNAIKNGMPTIVLKKMLGHETWEMIEVYVRLAEQDLKQSYTRFSPVDALEMHRYPKGKRAEMREWRTSRKQGKTN